MVSWLKSIGDFLLFLTCPTILLASFWLTFKTRFVQFRKFPHMFRLLFSFIHKQPEAEKGTIRAHKALFTAMSTTIGISTIVSPVIAIRLGGPGAVLGFVLAMFLGASVNFTEVTFAVSYRKNHPKKGIAGGPMQYLQDEIHPFLAKWYAFFGFILLMFWSSAQANQLGAILNSDYFHIPNWLTGIFLAVFVMILLIGGIKRVASFSSKLVPFMFLLYVGGAFWILFCNLEKLPAIFQMVIRSALTPRTFATGVTVGGLASAVRWGVFKGFQSNEAGVGTQTIPHSMAGTGDPLDQGILAMVAIYSAGFVCLLSSLVVLVTETWLDPTLSLGINMVAASFYTYFSSVGVVLVLISSFLFAFGTILGNGFNGSQCYSFLTQNRYLSLYYLPTAFLIFWGCISDTATIWTLVDYLVIPVFIPHILSLVYLSYKQESLLKEPPVALSSS